MGGGDATPARAHASCAASSRWAIVNYVVVPAGGSSRRARQRCRLAAQRCSSTALGILRPRPSRRICNVAVLLAGGAAPPRRRRRLAETRTRGSMRRSMRSGRCRNTAGDAAASTADQANSALTPQLRAAAPLPCPPAAAVPARPSSEAPAPPGGAAASSSRAPAQRRKGKQPPDSSKS